MREQGWLDSGLLAAHLAPVKNHNPKRASNSESELLLQVQELVDRDERMKIYDLTGFPGIKYFQGFRETGLFSLHRFFNCEAQINFWAFDLHGDVYACWDAAGLPHLSVGKYLPDISLDEHKLGRWRDRTSLNIESCQGCSSSAHCGGGCQFLAFEHNGTFESSSCDSMMTGYVESIARHSDWIMDKAIAGDHAIGMVTTRRIVTAIDKPFGILAERPVALPISCG
jgi:radical SAM protein with 4Fe4S-binding SPASM domain